MPLNRDDSIVGYLRRCTDYMTFEGKIAALESELNTLVPDRERVVQEFGRAIIEKQYSGLRTIFRRRDYLEKAKAYVRIGLMPDAVANAKKALGGIASLSNMSEADGEEAKRIISECGSERGDYLPKKLPTLPTDPL